MKDYFDDVIGYEDIKYELKKMCDFLSNREKYEKLGAKPIKGILLQGDPGTGKTTMAEAFIKSCGRKAYICRKTKSDGDFLKKIVKIFEEAKNNQPAVILLDDIDKYSSERIRRVDAEEFVTVQSCIDDLGDSDVFIIATSNDYDKLPESLLRAGRIGKTIEIDLPYGKDAEMIVAHYLKDKKVKNIDAKEVSRILEGYSCATLESVINDAALMAEFLVDDCGLYGFHNWIMDEHDACASENRNRAMAMLLENEYLKARQMLVKNRSFLDALIAAFANKDTLTAEDIRIIKSNS